MGPRWIAQKTNPPRARCIYIFTRLSHNYDTFLHETRKKLRNLPRLSLVNEKKNGSLGLLGKKGEDAAIQRAIKKLNYKKRFARIVTFSHSRGNNRGQSRKDVTQLFAIIAPDLELVMLQTNNYAINTRVNFKKKEKKTENIDTAPYFIIIRQRAIPCYLKSPKITHVQHQKIQHQ